MDHVLRSGLPDGRTRATAMSEHPINLGVRFALELAALWALGYWGWVAHAGPAKYLWSVGLVCLAAAAWGSFRVPNDGGPPVVVVSGRVRLLIEAAVFGGASIALLASGRRSLAIVLAVVVVLHYLVSYDRVLRLLQAR